MCELSLAIFKYLTIESTTNFVINPKTNGFGIGKNIYLSIDLISFIFYLRKDIVTRSKIVFSCNKNASKAIPRIVMEPIW